MKNNTRNKRRFR